MVLDYGLWSMEDYGPLTSPSTTAHNVSSDMSALSFLSTYCAKQLLSVPKLISIS